MGFLSVSQTSPLINLNELTSNPASAQFFVHPLKMQNTIHCVYLFDYLGSYFLLRLELSLPWGAGGGASKDQSIAIAKMRVKMKVIGMSRYLRIG